VNETMITVCGNVTADPKHRVRDDGLLITSFRVASTERKYDPGQKQWVDGETTWVNVSCFRALAANVALSVHKGERLIVHGRLRTRRWVSGERSGYSVDLDAAAVGHDLSWGTSKFTRVVRTEPRAPGRAEADEMATALEQEEWEAAIAGQPGAGRPAAAVAQNPGSGPEDDESVDDDALPDSGGEVVGGDRRAGSDGPGRRLGEVTSLAS